MKGVDATRHQTVSTWIIELLTVSLAGLGFSQYMILQLSFSAIATLITLFASASGFIVLRLYLTLRAFGGVF